MRGWSWAFTPPLLLSLQGQAIRDTTALAVDRSHGGAVMAALGFPVEAGWSWRSGSIAAQLLHAVGQTIGPSARGRVVEGFALTDAHQFGVPGIPTADSSLQLDSKPGRQVHHHVQVLASGTGVVLAKPDPPAATDLPTAPGCDPVAEPCEEVVQALVGRRIEVDRMDVERGLEAAADLVGEVLRTDGIVPLASCDPLRLYLAAAILARPASPSRSC